MVSTLLILGVIAAALGLAWSLLRSGHSDIRSLEDWETQRHEIDIPIFRLLLDRDEERYLRSSLSRNQYITFQRMRIRLALRMLRLVEENASMSMRLGQLANIKRDPALTQTANEVVATSGMISVPAFEEIYRHLLDCVVCIRQVNRSVQT